MTTIYKNEAELSIAKHLHAAGLEGLPDDYEFWLEDQLGEYRVEAEALSQISIKGEVLA